MRSIFRYFVLVVFISLVAGFFYFVGSPDLIPVRTNTQVIDHVSFLR